MTTALIGIHYIAYNPKTHKHAVETTEFMAIQNLIAQFKSPPTLIRVYKVMGQLEPPTIENGYIKTGGMAIQELYATYKTPKTSASRLPVYTQPVDRSVEANA